MKPATSNIEYYAWLVPAVLLIVAIFPLPYGYYTFLRVVVCGTAIFVAWRSYNNSSSFIRSSSAFWALVAVLFNPFIPVHLTKSIWVVIDLAVALAYLGHAFLVYRAVGLESKAGK